MAVAKNQKTGKWYAKFRYHDYTGRSIQKKKEGFARKADAQKWEQDFLSLHEGKESLDFKSAYEKYLADGEKRLKSTTAINKKMAFKHYEALYNIPIASIIPSTIRHWQNEYLLAIDPDTGKLKFTAQSISTINRTLSSFFQWCCSFCGLSSNPVRDAGRLSYKDDAEKPASKKAIWQKEDFEKFLSFVVKPDQHLIYGLLFWCGLRRGEVLGLRLKDVDLKTGTIYIRQNRTSAGISTPKTKSSLREITLPGHLIEEMKAYIKMLYKPKTNALLFENMSPIGLSNNFKMYQKKADIKSLIRLHDLRHSHASLLINSGFSPDVVADRLGHKNAQMVLTIYGHMYPQKRVEVTDALNKMYQE